jgi:hypothetical protein
MDEEKSAWSMLGKSAGFGNQTIDVEAFRVEIEELKEKVTELETAISVIQGELLGSIEALQRRVVYIEDHKTSSSVLDVIPVEELNEMLGTSIGQWPEIDEVEKEETIVVSSGLSYSKPLDEDNQLSVEEDGSVGEVSHKDCALAIVDFISDNGGVANADWKRRGLTPEHYEAKDRKKIDTILRETLGVVKWNKNNMWHFYYMDGDDKDESLERAYGTSQ